MATLTNLLTQSTGSVPPGTVISYAHSSIPSGYLKCNGAQVGRTTYAALFAAIGTTYGAGNGSTTFTLPDLRGEFIRGWDDGRTIDNGRGIGSFQDHGTQSHTHTTGNFMDYDFGSTGTHNGPHFTSANGRGSRTTSGNSGNAPAETRPRNVALLYCIKF